MKLNKANIKFYVQFTYKRRIDNQKQNKNGKWKMEDGRWKMENEGKMK